MLARSNSKKTTGRAVGAGASPLRPVDVSRRFIVQRNIEWQASAKGRLIASSYGHEIEIEITKVP
jgi:hypothetical protein